MSVCERQIDREREREREKEREREREGIIREIDSTYKVYFERETDIS